MKQGEILMLQNTIMMISSENKNNCSKQFFNKLKRLRELALIIFAFSALIYSLFFSSCANQGQGPSGGPRDTIAPLVTISIPENFQTNYSGKEINLTFNEFVVPDNLSEKLVISPPLAKKPEIKTIGKSIIIKISENLIPNRTYSIDFQDGIKDYTEGNKTEGLRIIFSTGNQLDSLQIGGHIFNAFNLTPVKDVLATLYTIDSDSVFRGLSPDFIARTNEEGYFLFDNLPPGQYKLYGLNDADKNLFFSQQTELIAFADSMISPSVKFNYEPDTIISGKDTIISKGHNIYSPDNVSLFLFEEKVFYQYIVSFKRDFRDRLLFVFSEPVTDSLKIDPIDSVFPESWNETELSSNKDTVIVYITDSTMIKTDTLFFGIKYTVTDSTGNFVSKTDTLKMIAKKAEFPKTKKKNDNTGDEQFFKFSSNIVSSNFDLNSNIIIEAPSPINELNKELFALNEMINDSTLKPLNFDLQQIKGSKRKFHLLFPLAEDKKYQLSIDTAVVKTISGLANAGFITKFTTQKADFYGSIILSLSGIEGMGNLLLLKFSEKEEVIKEITVEGPKKDVVFDFLKPEKYILKYYSDLNGNGKWDNGNLAENRQPEPVTYFQKVINVKSNWEIKENWELKPDVSQAKKIIDEDAKDKKTVKNTDK
jgi:hypothetical protein